MKNTAATFLEMKQKGEKISMLTCYDYSTAKLMEQAGVNGILVGDSLGNTMLGQQDTLSVTMEDMIHHGHAVAQACSNTMVVIDMPFMSYQASIYDAVTNAGRLMKEGRGNAVKLEGGAAVVEQIRAIVDAGIPVQAHIGMTPQSVNAFGGFKVQGKGEEAARQLLKDAYAVQEAGAFSVVMECVPPKLAALISIMPQSVLGGAAVMMFSSIVISGIQLITKEPLTARNITIVSTALGLGYGIGANGTVIAGLPEAVQLIFGGSGIVPAAILAIVLNIVIPREKKA